MTDDVTKRDLKRDLDELKPHQYDTSTIPLFGHKREDGTLVDGNGNEIEAAIFVCRNRSSQP